MRSLLNTASRTSTGPNIDSSAAVAARSRNLESRGEVSAAVIRASRYLIAAATAAEKTSRATARRSR